MQGFEGVRMTVFELLKGELELIRNPERQTLEMKRKKKTQE
jgi:hypothetical protein